MEINSDYRLDVEYTKDVFTLEGNDSSDNTVGLRWRFSTAPVLAYALGFQNDSDFLFEEDQTCSSCTASDPVEETFVMNRRGHLRFGWAFPQNLRMKTHMKHKPQLRMSLPMGPQMKSEQSKSKARDVARVAQVCCFSLSWAFGKEQKPPKKFAPNKGPTPNDE